MIDQFSLKRDKKAQTTQLPLSFAQEMKFAFVFNLKWKKKRKAQSWYTKHESIVCRASKCILQSFSQGKSILVRVSMRFE